MPLPWSDRSITDEEGSGRVGDFIRRALPMHRRLAATGWPVEVGWKGNTIWAKVRRGDLVITTDHCRVHWWWPDTRKHAIELADMFARILLSEIGKYAGADETGRVHVTLWRRPDGPFYVMEEAPDLVPERYVLELGWYVFMPNTGRWATLAAHRLPVCLEVPEALEQGIIRPEDRA